MEKFITPKRTRAERAELYRKKSSLPISSIGKSALTKYYLLEDWVRLYEYRLEVAKKEKEKEEAKEDSQKTKVGKGVVDANIEAFESILYTLRSAVDAGKGAIHRGSFTKVNSAIKERELIKAANDMKRLSEMHEKTSVLYKALLEETTVVVEAEEKLDEQIEKIERHDENVRAVKGLPSSKEDR